MYNLRMPFHAPIPESSSRDAKPKRGAAHSLVQAEGLMQIAFVLPCAMVMGWAAGWGVDHFFHLHWAIFLGLILGIVAGMVAAVRMAIQAMNSLSGRDGQ